MANIKGLIGSLTLRFVVIIIIVVIICIVNIDISIIVSLAIAIIAIFINNVAVAICLGCISNNVSYCYELYNTKCGYC